MIVLKGKIVLIDDDGYEKDLLESALRKRGWNTRVVYFDNAEDGLSHLKKNDDEIFLITLGHEYAKNERAGFKESSRQ